MSYLGPFGRLVTLAAEQADNDRTEIKIISPEVSIEDFLAENSLEDFDKECIWVVGSVLIHRAYFNEDFIQQFGHQSVL